MTDERKAMTTRGIGVRRSLPRIRHIGPTFAAVMPKQRVRYTGNSGVRPVRRRVVTITELLGSWTLTVAGAVLSKRRGKLVLHSFPDFTDASLSLLTETAKRGYRPVVLLEDREPVRSHLVQSLGEQVAYRAAYKNSARGYFHYLTSSHVFTTHGIYRPHRPIRKTVVNVWHGELGKHAGQFLNESSPVVSTHATAVSSLSKAFVCSTFGIHPRHVLIVGAPRNDRMMDVDRKAVRQKLISHSGDQLLLWMPTYRYRGPQKRDGRVDGVAFEGCLPLSVEWYTKLDVWLEEHEVSLIVKPHPSALKGTRSSWRRIHVLDEEDLAAMSLTTAQLLGAADALVTDASAVWVDFLLQDRPIFFYFPDHEQYSENRGLCLEPYTAWLPGPLIVDGTALIGELTRWREGGDGFAEVRQAFKDRLHLHQDAQSTSRLLDALHLRSATGSGARAAS